MKVWKLIGALIFATAGSLFLIWAVITYLLPMNFNVR